MWLVPTSSEPTAPCVEVCESISRDVLATSLDRSFSVHTIFRKELPQYVYLLNRCVCFLRHQDFHEMQIVK